MKPLLLVFLLVTASSRAFTFSDHYRATRETLKTCSAPLSEDAALMVASSTWLGMDGDRELCGTMVGVVAMEGGLTVRYDTARYFGFVGLQPATAYVSAQRFSGESKPREVWLTALYKNPGYATLLACRQFRLLKKNWKTTNNAIRVWNVGPEFRTDRGAWDRSAKYLGGVLMFRKKYIDNLQHGVSGGTGRKIRGVAD